MTAQRKISAAEAMEPYREMIEAALAYAGETYAYEDVVDAVQVGEMFFWPAEQSFLVTEVAQWPRKRVLHIFLAGGKLSEVKSMDESLVAYANFLDCDSISLSGRAGWEKALSDLGYKKIHTTLGKNLNG
tara:strand:- start:391 stop:780 length:390 start_codon:yes stop_codon:yes gene_type:complete